MGTQRGEQQVYSWTSPDLLFIGLVEQSMFQPTTDKIASGSTHLVRSEADVPQLHTYMSNNTIKHL